MERDITKKEYVMSSIQKKFDDLLASMNPGESFIIPGRGGWQYKMAKTDKGFDLYGHNPKEWGDGWFAVDTSQNQFGAPMFDQEPTLRFPFDYLGVQGTGNPLKDFLVGGLVMNDNLRVIPEKRFSWSNLRNKGIPYDVSPDRVLTVQDEELGHLAVVFEPDEMRMNGHPGVFTQHKPDRVVVLEMESLIEKAVKEVIFG